MHILDLIMYFVTAGLLWFIMDKLFNGEITHELGGLIGMVIMLIHLLIYIMVFVTGSYNWIDVFYSIKTFTLDIKL